MEEPTAEPRSCQADPTLKGCLCCFTPDRMFENAVDGIVALKIVGVDVLQAQKFVRLCVASTNMRLSKNKRKTAYKLGKCGPLTDPAIEAMQQCVVDAYQDVLKLLDGTGADESNE